MNGLDSVATFACALALAGAAVLARKAIEARRLRAARRARRGPIVWTRARGQRRRRAIRRWARRYGVGTIEELTRETEVLEACNAYASDQARRERLTQDEVRAHNAQRGHLLGAHQKVLRY